MSDAKIEYSITLDPPDRELSAAEKAAFDKLVSAAAKQFDEMFESLVVTGEATMYMPGCECVTVHKCGQP